MNKRPLIFDFSILSVFVIWVTWHSNFLTTTINQFELGLYLPGIQAILDGLVPYRDFFHLRGPFELYFPAIVMIFFGEKISVLMAYFYIGTVLTLLLYMLIGKNLFRTRLFFYLFVFAFVARTFPRVVFTFWGGLRYAFGALSILFVVKFLLKRKPVFSFLAGVSSLIAALISIEIGVYIFAGVVGLLVLSLFFDLGDREGLKKGLIYYFYGAMLVVIPYSVYLVLTYSLFDFIDSTKNVLLNMQYVFDMTYLSNNPKGFLDILCALVNPTHPNFKHAYLIYVYIIIAYFLFKRFYVSLKNNERNAALFFIFSYGVVIYFSAFRNIEGAQYEMALQPLYLLGFIFIEDFYFWSLVKIKSLDHKLKKAGFAFLILCICLGSFVYSFRRYSRRFPAYQQLVAKIFDKDIKKNNELLLYLEDGRVSGLIVPKWQGLDFLEVRDFVEKNTNENDSVLAFEELAIYHFIVNRPFVGRFPMTTFAWLNDQWHDEFLQELKEAPPKIALVSLKLDPWFEGAYFRVPGNREKYDEVLSFIESHYVLAKTTPSILIYRLK